MKKNTTTAVLLSVAVLGCASACSGHSSDSASAPAGFVVGPAGDHGASAVATASASSPASASASPAPTEAASAQAVPAVLRTLPAASPGWLAPSQVPLDASLHWTGGAASTAQNGVGLLRVTPILYPAADDGYATFVKDVVGFATNSFTATVGATGDVFNGAPAAVQEYVTYTDTAAAKAAYQAIEKDAASRATDDLEDVHGVPSKELVTPTASITDGFAYTDVFRTDGGEPAQVEGNYSMDSDYHTYVVLSGNVLEVLYLAGGPAVDGSAQDGAALTALSAAQH